MLTRLLALLLPQWRRALAGMALGALVIAANVALLALSGWFIAAMALSGHGGPRLEYFTPAAAIRGLAILRTMGRYGERVQTHDTTLRLLARLRVWLYERLVPLAPAGLARYRDGDLLNRLRADVDSLESVYLRLVLPMGVAALTIPLLALATAWFSGRAGMVVLAGLMLAGFGVPMALARLTRRVDRTLPQQRGAYAADLTDLTRGYPEWLVDGALPRLTARAEANAMAAQMLEHRLAWRNALGNGAGALILGGMLVAVLFALAAPVAQGRLDGPGLAMAALLVLGSFEAVAALPASLKARAELRGAAARIFDLTDAPPPVAEPTHPAPPPSRFDIEAQALTLGYEPDQPPIITGLTFSVPQGTCLAITGPSGAGKTSVLSALEGFWPLRGGRLTIGGTGLAALPSATLRELITVVPQAPYLFNTTIRENLLLAAPGADGSALWRALDEAALGDEVRAMPAGLETRVGEQGAALSGGQRRRLALARAFLRPRPILLLDEPTEGLDSATEQAVLAALARLCQGRTCLLTTHRQAPLRLANAVLELPAP
jgi:ATP-binding cassette subfamily C protein CydC